MNWGSDIPRPYATDGLPHCKTRELIEMLTFKRKRTRRIGTLLAFVTLSAVTRGADDTKRDKPGATTATSVLKVSYDKQVRPILQARCQGCHQPAKAGGRYVMTTFDRMLRGGESGEPAIVPSKPGESQLIELITPQNGKAEMPQDKPALICDRDRADLPLDRSRSERRHAPERQDAV